MSDSTDEARDDYTWDKAAQDLALGTDLTLREALALLMPFRVQEQSPHPYAVLPLLLRLCNAYSQHNYGTAAHFLTQLCALHRAAGGTVKGEAEALATLNAQAREARAGEPAKAAPGPAETTADVMIRAGYLDPHTPGEAPERPDVPGFQDVSRIRDMVSTREELAGAVVKVIHSAYCQRDKVHGDAESPCTATTREGGSAWDVAYDVAELVLERWQAPTTEEPGLHVVTSRMGAVRVVSLLTDAQVEPDALPQVVDPPVRVTVDDTWWTSAPTGGGDSYRDWYIQEDRDTQLWWPLDLILERARRVHAGGQ